MVVHVRCEPSSSPAIHLLQDRKTGPVVSGDLFNFHTTIKKPPENLLFQKSSRQMVDEGPRTMLMQPGCVIYTYIMVLLVLTSILNMFKNRNF